MIWNLRQFRVNFYLCFSNSILHDKFDSLMVYFPCVTTFLVSFQKDYMCIFYLGTWLTIRYKKPQIGFRHLTCLHQWLLDQYVIVVFRLIQNTCMYIFDLRGYLYWSVAVIHGTGNINPPRGTKSSCLWFLSFVLLNVCFFYPHLSSKPPFDLDTLCKFI